MASLTQCIWVWVNSGSWWWTGTPFMGSQRVGHYWVTELNWMISNVKYLFMCVLAICMFYLGKCIFRFFPIFFDLVFFEYWTAWGVCISWRVIPCQSLQLQPFWCLFDLPMVSVVMQKILSLIRSHLFIFAFISNILRGGSLFSHHTPPAVRTSARGAHSLFFA